MDVVAEQVAVQERAAAVRLHEQLDGRFLLRLAAEDLGDDAFHLAAIALVDQPRAPGDQRVAADDQAGQPADAPLDQLARGDRLRRRSGGTRPRAACWPASPASCRRRWRTGRQPAEVQAVIGDRQAVAARRLEQVLGGTRKSLNCRPLLYACLQGVQAVVARAGSARSPASGRSTISTAGLLVDQADQADRCGRGRRW